MNRQEHLVDISMEECAEMIQRLSKAQRFGMDQIQKDADDKPEENPEGLDNRTRIWREYLDLVGTMRMLGFDVDTRTDDDNGRITAKQIKIERYFDRSRATGTLVDEMFP